MLKEISNHLYYLENDEATNRPFLGYLRGNRFSMMLDAGNSPSHVALYMEAVREKGFEKPSFAGITHWHWDHSFGIASLDIPTIASQLTNDQLRAMSAWKWDNPSMNARIGSGDEIAFSDMNIRNEYRSIGIDKIVVKPADIGFEKVLTIDLGGVRCECHHVGGPHSSDASIFYIPEERFVFLGDSCGKDLYGLEWSFDPDHMENFGEILANLPFDPKTLWPYIEYLQKMEFDNCLVGHVGFFGKKALLDDLRLYI